MQAAETVLGPINGTSSPASLTEAVIADSSEQEQQQAEDNADKKGDSDDSGVDSTLGLLNAGPIQMKTDLEQPVTSGGMETTSGNPSDQD